MRKTLVSALLVLVSFMLAPAPTVGAEEVWKQLPALAPLPESETVGPCAGERHRSLLRHLW